MAHSENTTIKGVMPSELRQMLDSGALERHKVDVSVPIVALSNHIMALLDPALGTQPVPAFIVEIEAFFEEYGADSERQLSIINSLVANPKVMDVLKKPENIEALRVLCTIAVRVGSTALDEILKTEEYADKIRQSSFMAELKTAWNTNDRVFVKLMRSPQFAHVVEAIEKNDTPLYKHYYSDLIEYANTTLHYPNKYELLPAFFPNPNMDRLVELWPSRGDSPSSSVFENGLRIFLSKIKQYEYPNAVPDIFKTMLPALKSSAALPGLLEKDGIFRTLVAEIEDKFNRDRYHLLYKPMSDAYYKGDKAAFSETLHSKELKELTSRLIGIDGRLLAKELTVTVGDFFRRTIVLDRPDWLDIFIPNPIFEILVPTGQMDGDIHQILEVIAKRLAKLGNGAQRAIAWETTYKPALVTLFSSPAVRQRIEENAALGALVKEDKEFTEILAEAAAVSEEGRASNPKWEGKVSQPPQVTVIG